MKRLSRRLYSFWSFVFLLIPVFGFSASISFPDFYLYSKMNENLEFSTSYSIDMLFDTGLKYGVEVGIGLQNYNITDLSTNTTLQLDNLSISIDPLELFSLKFFVGKNTILGLSDYGYQGFQFHERENLEYIGYHTVRGTGLEFYRSFWDEMFTPHLYVYSAPILAASSNNAINFDGVVIFEFDNYKIEGYFGMNYVKASTNWNKHFGITIASLYSKVDFSVSLYSPDTPLLESLAADNLYVNITEHVLNNKFEQTLSVFMRPRYYNGYEETLTNDADMYLQLGMAFDSFGFGIENILRYAQDFDLGEKLGAYTYFVMNNLKYKIGFYYSAPIQLGTTAKTNPFTDQYGIFMDISGNL